VTSFNNSRFVARLTSKIGAYGAGIMLFWWCLSRGSSNTCCSGLSLALPLICYRTLPVRRSRVDYAVALLKP